MAAAVVPIAQAATKLLGALFAAHTARLKGAKTENAAVASVITPFDQDVAQLVQLWNTGQIAPADFISKVNQVDQYVYGYMHSLAGKQPGTAWDDSVGMSGKCNKQCTAACCVYFGDLGPVLSNMITAAGGTGKWGANDPRLSIQPGGAVITVPEVFASKYGGVDRKGYTVTMLNVAQRPNNPAPYAQTGMNLPSVPLGRLSEGTPAGQTSTFSQQSQAQLVNASVLASFPGTGPVSPTQTTGAGGRTALYVIGALAAALAVGLAVGRR